MTNIEKIQAICAESLQVAELCSPPASTTICALVEVIGGIIDNPTELQNRAFNVIAELRDGHKIPVNRLIDLIERLAMIEPVKVAA